MKHSIRFKFALLLFLTTFVLSVVLLVISNRISRDIIDDMYEERTADIAKSAAAVIDPKELSVLKDEVLKIYSRSDPLVSSEQWGSPEFEKYVGQFQPIYELPEYHSTLESLRRIQDVNHVNCIYIYYADLDKSNFIYLADADSEEPCPVGCIDSYEWGSEQTETLKVHPEKGILPYITRTEEYGWLVSTMMPIFD